MDGQTSNKDIDPLIASGSRRQSSSCITDPEVRSIVKESDNSDEAVRKLAKLVDNLRERTEGLEIWAKKSGGNPSFEKPRNPPILYNTPGPEFELTAKFLYFDQTAWYMRFGPEEGHPFIKARWARPQVDALSPRTGNPNPESADILEFCMHSRVMRDYLDHLAVAVIQGGDPLSDSRISKLEDHDGTISFCKPFRWLIQHRHLIEKDARSLEEDRTRFQPHRANGENPGAATEPLSLEDDLLPQLRYLLAFMEEHLGEQLQRYEDAQTGKFRTIRFQDLWMLYKPGNLIYTPSRRKVEVFNREIPRSVITKRHELGGAWVGANVQQEIESDDDGDEKKPVIVGTGTPQAYRIAAVMGGLPIEGPKKTSSRALELYHPLRVVRYYLDFNGMRYDCEILSLPAYPLAYAPDPEKPLGAGPSGPGATAMLKFLSRRGRSFVQVSEASHRLYEGLTVGQTKEKINTPVVIDLKLAYTTFPGLQPQASLPDADGYLNVDTKDRQIHVEITGNFRSGSNHFKAVRSFDWYQRHQQKLTEKATVDLNDNLGSYPSVSLDTPDAIEKIMDAMSRDDYLCLLPGTVYAYALRSRKWGECSHYYPHACLYFADRFANLVRPADNLGNWDDLILPSGLKDMVEAVVETHIGRSQSTARVRRAAEVDIETGVLYSCTASQVWARLQRQVSLAYYRTHIPVTLQSDTLAECVAAFTQRPLLPITCGKLLAADSWQDWRLISTTGDIGYEPAEVERSLEKLFTLAHHWGCVVLLDEADVFLAKRSYYQGILFLTTNRVGSFDDAFRSRLHLTLYYPKLDRKQTVAIWNVNLRRLDELNKKRLEYGEQPIEVQKDRILKFAKREWQKLSWNGRQIRNAFQTAVALAEFDANKANDAAKKSIGDRDQHIPPSVIRPVITKKHFETIAGTSMQFDEYLYLAHGRSDESNNAKRDQVRWDYELQDTNQNQQRQRLKRLGGNHKFSSDSSSSDNDGGTETGSYFPADSSGQDDHSDSGSSSNSDSDEKMKRKKKSNSSKSNKDKSKGDKERKHRSRKDKI
ncbi:atpase aaa+ type core protein [Apiospora hydei]|uniref:Atpase aaa+ type core protein n=1 Tax=Apiospora hydei TaxID=1337664 RepID=A0ABR1WB43_9PEZI